LTISEPDEVRRAEEVAAYPVLSGDRFDRVVGITGLSSLPDNSKVDLLEIFLPGIVLV
jgi:hypothetical protein